MKIVASKALCSGHARCAAAAPALFDLDDEGFIAFTEKEISPDKLNQAQRGVRACPERALKLEE